MGKNLLKSILNDSNGKILLKSLIKAVSGFQQSMEPTVIEDEGAKQADLDRMGKLRDDMWGTDKAPASMEHTNQIISQSQPPEGVHFLQDKRVNPEHRQKPWKAYEIGHGNNPGKPLNDGLAMSHSDLLEHLKNASFDPHRTVIAPSHGQGDWVQFIQHPTFKDHARNVIGNMMYESSRGPASWHETVRQQFSPKSINAMNPAEVALLRKK